MDVFMLIRPREGVGGESYKSPPPPLDGTSWVVSKIMTWALEGKEKLREARVGARVKGKRQSKRPSREQTAQIQSR